MTRYWALILGCAVAAVLALATAPTMGAVPRADELGMDPSFADWFHSLRQPRTARLCCSETDCRAVEYRLTGTAYEIRPDPAYDDRVRSSDWDRTAWFVVPAEVVLRRDNPTGHAIACYYVVRSFNRSPSLDILCFVPDWLI